MSAAGDSLIRAARHDRDTGDECQCPKCQGKAQLDECSGVRAGFYVYTLADPRDGKVFYVGKGCGTRDRSHLWRARRSDVQNPEKTRRIRAIEASGAQVVVNRIATDLAEAEAFRKEREKIAEIGIANLANVSPGQRTEPERVRLSIDLGMEVMASHLRAALSGGAYSAVDVGRIFQIVRELREARETISA